MGGDGLPRPQDSGYDAVSPAPSLWRRWPLAGLSDGMGEGGNCKVTRWGAQSCAGGEWASVPRPWCPSFQDPVLTASLPSLSGQLAHKPSVGLRCPGAINVL